MIRKYKELDKKVMDKTALAIKDFIVLGSLFGFFAMFIVAGIVG